MLRWGRVSLLLQLGEVYNSEFLLRYSLSDRNSASVHPPSLCCEEPGPQVAGTLWRDPSFYVTHSSRICWSLGLCPLLCFHPGGKEKSGVFFGPVKVQMQGICALLLLPSPSPKQSHGYEPHPFLNQYPWKLGRQYNMKRPQLGTGWVGSANHDGTS